VGVPALGGRPGDLLLDELPEVEDLAQLVPGGEGAGDHLVGLRADARLDESAAAPAPAGGDVAGRMQALQRLPDGGPADLQRGRELALGRQRLAGHELAERDRGHEPLGDPLARRPQRQRGQQRAEGVSGQRRRGIAAGHAPPPGGRMMSGSPGRPARQAARPP
jgi:hypothetical protein